MRNYTHPLNDIQTRDFSDATRVSRVERCLHRPLYFMQAPKGTARSIGWFSGPEAIKEFGVEAFDMFGKWYNNEQFFLENTVFPYQGAYITNLPDPTATTATIVLELHVTPTDVIQYERDAYGGTIKDVNGDPIPVLDSSNQPIKEPGYKFKYVTRQLLATEKFKYLRPSVVDIGGVQTTIYPLIDSKYRSTGNSGNAAGFKVFYDYTYQDEVLLSKTEALQYTFSPVQKLDGSSLDSPIRDLYDAVRVNFTAKPNQVDTRVQMRLSFEDKIYSNYHEANAANDIPLLPYDINIYSENFKLIGDLVAAVEMNDMSIADKGWMVDVLSMTNLDGYLYHHTIIEHDATTVVCNEGYTLYLSGGTDGDISREAFEERIRQFLSGDVFPEIIDNLRFPITHIYDVGYTWETKRAMAHFMSIRDDVRPQLSSQDCNMEANTREEDQSLGAAVRGACLLTPESIVFGTPCCRASVYCHAGYSTNPQYRNLLPLTFWAAQRRAETQRGMVMKKTLGGRPTSVVNMLRNINYTEYSPKVKQLKFDNGLNYIQYGDEENLFFPDLRSVYLETTSMLASESYVDAVIYTKYISRWIWAKYVGSEGSPEEMYQKIGDDISKACYNTFGTIYGTDVIVDQTDEMKLVGDAIQIRIRIFGNGVYRRGYTIIEARRNNNTSTNANS